MVDVVSNSKELVDTVSNLSSNPKVSTQTSDVNSAIDTTDRYSPHKLLTYREIPAIIQGVILTVHQVTTDEVLACVGVLHAVRTVLLEEIVTNASPNTAPVFKDPPAYAYRFQLIRTLSEYPPEPLLKI